MRQLVPYSSRLKRHFVVPEGEGREVEEGEEVSSLAVRAGGQPATGFAPLEGPLTPVPLLVEGPVIGLDHPAAGSRRNDRRGALPFKGCHACLTLRGSVSNDVAGVEAGEQRPGLRIVGPLPSGHPQADGLPLTIHGQMTLGGPSASGLPPKRVPVLPFPVTAC